MASEFAGDHSRLILWSHDQVIADDRSSFRENDSALKFDVKRRGRTTIEIQCANDRMFQDHFRVSKYLTYFFQRHRATDTKTP